MPAAIQDVLRSLFGLCLVLYGSARSFALFGRTGSFLVLHDFFVFLSPLFNGRHKISLTTIDWLKILALLLHLLSVKNLPGKPVHVAMVSERKSIHAILVSIVHVLLGVAQSIKYGSRNRMGMKPNKRYFTHLHPPLFRSTLGKREKVYSALSPTTGVPMPYM